MGRVGRGPRDLGSLDGPGMFGTSQNHHVGAALSSESEDENSEVFSLVPGVEIRGNALRRVIYGDFEQWETYWKFGKRRRT